jgi:DNA-binding Lrp family transcriptional regulator
MSKMSDLVTEIQEMLEDNIGAPNGLTIEQIAKKLNVPPEWVHCEYEFMLEETYG